MSCRELRSRWLRCRRTHARKTNRGRVAGPHHSSGEPLLCANAIAVSRDVRRGDLSGGAIKPFLPPPISGATTRRRSTTIAPNTVGEIVWPCLSKSRWPTSRSIWKRLLVRAGCEMPSASDALRKLAWSARASTCRNCRNSTRSLPGYRRDNLWKIQDANSLAIPFAHSVAGIHGILGRKCEDRATSGSWPSVGASTMNTG
jgi:hypothetical protein